MPVYSYESKRGPEEIIKDRIEADSEKEAIEKLSRMGYIPIRLEEVKYSVEAKVRSSKKTKGKIKSRQITVFSRELSSLLKSGVPILRGLNIILEQSENPNLKDVLNNIHEAIKSGTTFSSALSQYSKVFPPIYVAMIRAGEDSGTLPEALLRIADYRAKQEELLSRLRMALAYPILMAMVGLGTIIFMFTFVMPRLMKIFVNLGESLPLPTRILISITHGLREKWFWIILALLIVFLIFKRQSKTETGKMYLSKMKLQIPMLGKMILKAELSRFCRTLELLIKNGIPILNAINIAIPILGNEVLTRQLKQSYKELEQGGSLGKSLKKDLKLFPLFMVNLISVGEESGGLDEALGEIAASYEHDTDEALRIISSLLEPIMILGMGLIIGFMVIAMLLPIFEINVMAR